MQSQDAPLAGNPPARDRGPFAGEADPTCAPCEVPAGKEEGRDAGEREGAFECNICLDVATDPVVTQCGHLYCWPCIYKYVRRAQDPQRRMWGFAVDLEDTPTKNTVFSVSPDLRRPTGRPRASSPRGSRTPPSRRARSPPNSADRSPQPRPVP